MRAPGFALWALVAGAFIPIMAVLNGRLARNLGAPVLAAVVLFAVGLVTAMVASLVIRGELPSTRTLLEVAPIDLAGGVIVAFYIVSVTTLAPRFGIGNTIMFAMASQVATSTAIDHFGWLGTVAHRLSWPRGIGIALLMIGLLLTQIGKART